VAGPHIYSLALNLHTHTHTTAHTGILLAAGQRRARSAGTQTSSAGHAHSLVVTRGVAEGATSTRVWSFGLSDGGLLGHGNGAGEDARTYEYVPRPIVALDHIVVVEVAAGVAHSIARTATGELFSWGSGEHGRLGHGTSDDESTPTHLICLRNVTSIAAGGRHSMAAAGLDGQCYTWGSNEFGQLGLGIAGRVGSAFATPMQAKQRPALGLPHDFAVPNEAVRGTTNVAAGMVRWYCTTLKLCLIKHPHARGTPPRELS
jgi:alpha-tubulin suppressor-like RCC1 family protein